MSAITHLKRTLIGDPRATGELSQQLLPRWLALPVFSSDTLSSVAYATEEMLVVLAVAGAAGMAALSGLSVAIAVLMVVVLASYTQTVRAYPHGGGAYLVAGRNLSRRAGLVAAAALLIDYTLTAAVSIAAGTAAIVSAAPGLQPWRLGIALSFVLLMTVANLRGVREAGAVVAVPVYAFVVLLLAMIGVGLARCVGGCPPVPFEQPGVPAATGGLTLWLLLRAFATGSTALTGVEAVSNGVGAFREPQARNAASVLVALGVLGVTMFVGLSYLATRIPGVTAFEGSERTVVAQIAGAVFGAGTIAFYAVQVATAAILILAANTAYADFPRLASLLADDGYLPRQLAVRGDRLVHSNGIVALSLLTGLLLVVANGRVTGLVSMFVVGVFTSFALSQAGMVRHWLRERGRRWRLAITINAVGAAATAVVLVITAVTKFLIGAWVVVVAIPLLVVGMAAVRRHYDAYAAAVTAGPLRREEPGEVHAVILEDRVDAATAAALAYARGIGAASIRAVLVPPPTRRGVRARWRSLSDDLPSQEVPFGIAKSTSHAMYDAARRVAEDHPHAFTTAIVPETRSVTWSEVARRHFSAQRVKARLVADGHLVVANVVAPPGGPGPYQVADPVEHHVVVLVNTLHAAAFRAIAYAESLASTTTRALSVNVAGERSGRLLSDWQRAGLTMPLDLVDSPFRAVTDTIVGYVRELKPDGQHTVVTVVIGEHILPGWWQRGLHNQSALLIKSALLFTRGVVTTSVPYRLPPLARPQGVRTSARAPARRRRPLPT